MENLYKQIKQGDKQRACNRVNVSRTVLDRALKKSDVTQCTDGELRVLKALREVIDERKQMLAEIQS